LPISRQRIPFDPAEVSARKTFFPHISQMPPLFQSHWTIIMLPGCPVSEIRLRLNRLPVRPDAPVLRFERIDADRKGLGDVEFQRTNNVIIFRTALDDFGYGLVWSEEE
jgi:hypothetical protein